MLRNSQLKAYFDRIGFKGLAEEAKSSVENQVEQAKPTLELLTKLHELHVFSIPFENLSIHLKQDIQIDIEIIYKKLVEKQRGGYCYEMNGLFYTVLKTLGFDVELHLAEVSEKGSELRSRKETHLILIVHLDGKNYLADVGFGRNGLIHPLILETENAKQKQIYSSVFEVRYDEINGFVYGVHFNDQFNIEYRFDLPIKTNLTLTDLQEYSDDISKRSHFTKMILVSKPTKEGRKMLFNDTLKHLNGSDSKKITIDTHDAYLDILMSEFGIRFSEILSFDNVPILAEKINKLAARSVSLVRNDNPIKIETYSQSVLPTSNPVLMYGRGNKLASGKVTMWSFDKSSQNEPEA